MKMVFQGKTPHQLAKQLIDPKQNGHKDFKKLIAHADECVAASHINLFYVNLIIIDADNEFRTHKQRLKRTKKHQNKRYKYLIFNYLYRIV